MKKTLSLVLTGFVLAGVFTAPAAQAGAPTKSYASCTAGYNQDKARVKAYNKGQKELIDSVFNTRILNPSLGIEQKMQLKADKSEALWELKNAVRELTKQINTARKDCKANGAVYISPIA